MNFTGILESGSFLLLIFVIIFLAYISAVGIYMDEIDPIWTFRKRNDAYFWEHVKVIYPLTIVAMVLMAWIVKVT